MEKRNFFDFNTNWINDIKVGFGKNAWYIQKPLCECRNLFFGIKSDFIVHFFGCDCGENKIYINISDDSIKHVCQKCGREQFTFLKYADRKTAYVNLKNTYSFNKTETHYAVTCYLKYPKYIDINTNSLGYENKVAYELRMDKDCVYSSRVAYRISDEVRERARAELIDFIGQDLQKKIKDFKVLQFNSSIQERKEKIIALFIKNPTLIEANFYLIDEAYIHTIPKKQNYTMQNMLDDLLPKSASKALKKALYMNYKRSIKKGYFHVSSKIVVFYIFKDQNFSRRLLERDISFRYFAGHDLEEEITLLKDIFTFLKKFYTQKELFKICLQIKEHRQLWKDAVLMYKNSSYHIQEVFTRVNANLIHVHNAFVSCIACDNETVTFKHTKEAKLAMGLHEGLRYVLPKSSKTLFNWGIKLRNCLVIYTEKVTNKQSAIVGVFEDKKLKYALEIDLQEGDIIQMSAFANKQIPKPQTDAIKRWHKNVWLKTILEFTTGNIK